MTLGLSAKNIGCLLIFVTIWELEASRCDQNDVRGCANISHHRKLHSENFHFLIIFEPPPPPRDRGQVPSICRFWTEASNVGRAGRPCLGPDPALVPESADTRHQGWASLHTSSYRSLPIYRSLPTSSESTHLIRVYPFYKSLPIL